MNPVADDDMMTLPMPTMQRNATTYGKFTNPDIYPNPTQRRCTNTPVDLAEDYCPIVNGRLVENDMTASASPRNVNNKK